LLDRKDYFKEYNKKRRQKQLTYFHEKYQREKIKRLQYARKRYILLRSMILAKLKKQSVEFIGHAQSIHKAVVKYAKEWKLPYSEWNEFKEWTVDDLKYEELFNDWKTNLFNIQYSPVAMRLVKKNGFVVGNLEWKRKGEYSWWSEDKVLIQQIEKNLNEEQKVLNKRDKTWQEKTKEQIKNLKRKKK
jgi:hypothetical protein